MSQLHLTHTDVAVADSPMTVDMASPILEGCSVQSDGVDTIRVPKMTDGSLVIDSQEGSFVEIFDWVFKNGIFPNNGDKITIPDLGALSAQEIVNHPEFANKLWAKQIKEGDDLIGLEDVTYYSVAPTGRCFNKNVKYYDVEKITLNGEVITLNGEFVTGQNLT